MGHANRKHYATFKIIFSDIDNLCFCYTATRGQRLTAKLHIFSVLENILELSAHHQVKGQE